MKAKEKESCISAADVNSYPIYKRYRKEQREKKIYGPTSKRSYKRFRENGNKDDPGFNDKYAKKMMEKKNERKKVAQGPATKVTAVCASQASSASQASTSTATDSGGSGLVSKVYNYYYN